jgi:uncharacterized protein with FMN-binding domain
MRKTITTLLATLALAVPTANAWAATRQTAATAAKKKTVVVSRKFVGVAAQTDRWGYTQVTIVVRKTSTTIGTKKTVKRRITSVSATAPNHTDRSIRINEQAIPILRQETLSAQSARINLVSGATDTSYAFAQSLQSAILKARRA